MLDFIQGILALIIVVGILLMRESENKWIAYLGFAILILAKLLR